MGIISVDKLSPGMVLAEKVLTSKRMLLLPEGTVITEGHLITFQTWGITEVNIVGEDQDNADDNLSDEEREALKEEISKIFKFNNLEGKFTKKMFALACEHAGKNK